MTNLLSQLTKDAQVRLLEALNYLNLEEIRGFCSERGIPYKILAEYRDGKVKILKDTDRKPIVLARIRHYLPPGKAGQPTCISAKIVRDACNCRPSKMLRRSGCGTKKNGAIATIVPRTRWCRSRSKKELFWCLNRPPRLREMRSFGHFS